MTTGVLSGLRVIELSAFVAAPLAGATLASMGAEVLRVEHLGGGIDAHRWPVHEGRSLYRSGLDQGKKSLTIDLHAVRGQELVTDLICSGGADGGVVVTNLGARDWMSYERLGAKRPDLIMVAISGFPNGAIAVDYTVNAGIGFPLVTGPKTWEGPVNHVLPAWDVATGFLASIAVLAAERHRRLTGQGQLVNLALSDVALAVAGHLGFLSEARLVEEPRQRYGNDLYGTYARDFQTRDGRYLIVCALTPRQWKNLGQATGLAESFAAVERTHGIDLTDEGERFLHRDEISALIAPWVRERTLAEVGRAFDALGVLWSPYRTFKELAGGDVSERHASPLDFGAFPRAGEMPAPEIGADSRRLLQGILGLDDVELSELESQGVIESGPDTNLRGG